MVREAGRHSDQVLDLATLLHCSVEESYDMKIESLDEKDKVDLSEYFGALKDSPIIGRDRSRFQEDKRAGEAQNLLFGL